MRRIHFLWMVSWIVLGLNACTTFRPPDSARPDTAKACADWRWIGISRTGARCPEVPGWTVRPLFPQLSPVACYGEIPRPEVGIPRPKVEIPRPEVNEVIQELSRFCTYEITSPIKSLKHVPFPPAASNDLERFDQDCAALSVSATMKQAGKDWEDHYKEFFKQAGKPSEEKPLKINNRLGVRLAFLDTQPDGMGTPQESGRSPHGYTLAHIARQLVCTQGADEHCAAQITTRLAMPIIDFDPKKRKHNLTDTVRGGFLGMQSDLAAAIQSEVDDWRYAKQQGKGQEHLVLNLSMAWDGDLFGGLDEEQISELKAGTQAIYRALQYAAGFDVLVLAAAGNQKGAPCENTGPLLPGGWESGGPQSCGKPPMLKPVVYAVGGVRSDGQPLLNARPGGMPLRAAYGENAVVPAEDPKKLPVLLTGSSVSTAVVSAIAAIVWDTRPDLDHPYQVMEILNASGDVLLHDADFWFGASVPPHPPFGRVRRVSLCAALAEACSKNPDPKASCPVELPCNPWPAHRPPDDAELKLATCEPWLFPQPEDDPKVVIPPKQN